MTFRLWCGFAQTEEEYRTKKPLWRPRLRDSLHDALWKAMKVNDVGVETAWEIEGDGGFHLNRQEIADMIVIQRNMLIANPPRAN